MSESTDRLRDMSRRRFLAAGATVSATAVAGCNTVVNAVFGAILEDVNVVNDTDQRRVGTVTVTDPADETVLEESFDVPYTDDDSDEAQESNIAVFEDVYTETGEYTVAIDLDAESAIDGTERTTQTVTVSDTENEHIMAMLESPSGESRIATVVVIEKLTDLQEYAANDSDA